ncbi:MAG: hypothetical protein RMJ38_06045 [candidate division WOR-3 bacterium]|nr:hypothetical protein [candidate division WOR-3 bacterium]MDW8150983.1 hypothetical protein [candidate division WOR-3 bacterium]
MRAILDFLALIDRRIIYAVLIFAIILPLFLKPTLPSSPTKEVIEAYNAVESLKEDDIILISTDYGPSAYPELQPVLEVVLEQSFKKNVKVLLMTHWQFEGLIVGINAIEKVAKRYNKVYGKDYLILGFKPGVLGVMIGLSEDFRKVFPTDYYGKPIDSYEIYKKLIKDDTVLNYKDINLLFGFEAGATGDSWVQIVQARYGVKMAFAVTAVMAPGYFPYYQAKQIVGLVGGLKGAFDYESLNKSKGLASLIMISQVVVHSVILVFILLGNVGFIIRRILG